MSSKTLCLVMIVKNEEKVIKRALDSIVNYLDYWVICDTGSTDRTKEIITKYFEEKNVKGELHDEKWVNFGHNRSKVVQMAQNKADFLVLMDADFIFVPKDKNFKNNLSKNIDSYLIKYEGNLDYRQILLVNGKYKWKYIGVTHEYICSDEIEDININSKKFDGFTFNHKGDGGERKNKFTRDIQLLSDALKKEPKNGRYMFYLAQSYKDTNDNKNAIKWYEERIKIGGWDQEIYYSLYQIAVCKYRIEKKFTPKIIKSYLNAYNFRPSRLEALHDLVKGLRLEGRNREAFKVGINGIETKYPDDVLFVDKNIHLWRFNDELALVSYYSGRYSLAKYLTEEIFRYKYYPKDQEERLVKNYKFYINKCNDIPDLIIPN
jgi:glycosyltransferase involved in cell wall biosynthesis